MRLEAILPKTPEGLDAVSPRSSKRKESASKQPAHGKTGSLKDFCFKGFKLDAWAAQHGATFKIEAALRSHEENNERFRTVRSDGGVHIECPFEYEHTNQGGSGTFVVNAGDNGERGMGIHCCHNSCLTSRGNGQAVDRLVFIKEMLELGWLTLDDLQNPEMGGGQISARVYHQGRSQLCCCDLRVIDKAGKGIDVSVFHANLIAKAGNFDFSRLNELCRTQITDDVTPEQLAEFVEAGRVTAENLIACAKPNPNQGKADSAYIVSLRELAEKRRNGDITARDVTDQLKSNERRVWRQQARR